MTSGKGNIEKYTFEVHIILQGGTELTKDGHCSLVPRSSNKGGHYIAQKIKNACMNRNYMVTYL